MPFAYARDDDRRRLTLTGTGTVTREEATAAIDRQIAEGVWTYGILYDIRNVETLPKSSELFEIRDHVRGLARQYGPRGPVAVVATRSRNEQRVRTYTSLTDPSERLETFTSIEEASRWLAEQLSAGTS